MHAFVSSFQPLQNHDNTHVTHVQSPVSINQWKDVISFTRPHLSGVLSGAVMMKGALT